MTHCRPDDTRYSFNYSDANARNLDTILEMQKRIKEFESLINAFKNDQTEIESTILNVIKKLDFLEDYAYLVLET